MRMNKRGSTFLIVFFIAMVMVIFYLIGMQGQAPGVDSRTAVQTERTYNHAETLKRFTFITAEEALSKASYEVLQEMQGYRIINDGVPNPPDLEYVNNRIEERARAHINEYLALAEGQEFGNVVLEETTAIDAVNVDVSALDMVEGTVFDNFGASFTGYNLNVVANTQTGEESTFVHMYDVGTQCDRTYYLLNGMKEWATTNTVTRQACAKIPAVMAKGSGKLYYPVIDKTVVDEVIAAAHDELNEIFDENVECTIELNDFKAETEPIPTGTIEGDCPKGDGVVKCGGGCPADKEYVTEYYDCEGQESTVKYEGHDWEPAGKFMNIACGSIGTHHELMIDATVTCIDYKCKKPISAEEWEYNKVVNTIGVDLTHHRDPDPLECKNLRACAGSKAGPATTTNKKPSNPSRDSGGNPGGGGN
jgi:hypothetical protein